MTSIQELPIRAQCALVRLFHNGTVYPAALSGIPDFELKRLGNCGKKTIKALRDWQGGPWSATQECVALRKALFEQINRNDELQRAFNGMQNRLDIAAKYAAHWKAKAEENQ